MILVFLVAVSLTPVQVNITLAPDQPMPYVYADDPLIVEFNSQDAVEGSASLQVTPDFDAQPQQIDLGKIRVNSKSSFWLPAPQLSLLRGRYHVKAQLNTAGGAVEEDLVFCRIDRPVPEPVKPAVRVKVEQFYLPVGLALKSAGISAITMNLGTGDTAIGDILAAEEAGFDVTVSVGKESIPNLEGAAKELAGKIAGWRFDLTELPVDLQANVKLLRQAGSNVPVFVVLKDTSMLEPLLASGDGVFLDGIVFESGWPGPVERDALRSVTERAGYENLALVFSMSAEEDAAGTGEKFVAAAIQLLGEVTGLEVGFCLAFGKSFGPAYPYLATLTQRLSDMEYAGRLEVDPGVQSPIFRAGGKWVVVFWTSEGQKEVSMPMGTATDVQLFDGRNNLLETPSSKDGVLKLVARTEPQFLTGNAGNVLAAVAESEVHRIAEAFCSSSEIQEHMPEDIASTVKKFTAGNTYTRVDFFNLLKLFPAIEELWHTGNVPRSVAVPALSLLSRLVVSLSTLEQERNEPFVEPLQSILANCGQRLSLYLTGSTTWSAHERSDWLLSEVNGIMERAEAMSSQGRLIEAGALANVADWRARALTAAMRAAPLGIPEKVQQPKPKVVQAEPKEEKKEPVPEKKPSQKTSSSKSRQKSNK